MVTVVALGAVVVVIISTTGVGFGMGVDLGVLSPALPMYEGWAELVTD